MTRISNDPPRQLKAVDEEGRNPMTRAQIETPGLRLHTVTEWPGLAHGLNSHYDRNLLYGQTSTQRTNTHLE